MKPDLTKTHERRILAWLLEGHEIDLQKSQAMFRCASLRSRIADLRKKGYAIKKRMQKFIAPSGAHGAYAVYSLEKPFNLYSQEEYIAFWRKQYRYQKAIVDKIDCGEEPEPNPEISTLSLMRQNAICEINHCVEELASYGNHDFKRIK